MSTRPDTSFLWHDVDTAAVKPPVATRTQFLPLQELPWEDFERLCFRLAHRFGDVEDVRIYGTRGQTQDGIDVYVRRSTGDYETWQCKRYQEFKVSDITAAVKKFLEGDWAGRTAEFRLAVSASLQETDLADEIEKQRALLTAKNIKFKPMDRYGLSERLKSEPDLVDDFFGRAWVEVFNGKEAAASLIARKLTREQRLRAGSLLRDLYTSHFNLVDVGIPAAAPAFRGAVRSAGLGDRYVEPDVEVVESVVEEVIKEGGESGGFKRRDVRRKQTLSQVLADSERLLLVGAAGFGKSTAMRMVVMDLLGSGGRFAAVAKKWGNRLPLLVPFGFLVRHFRDAQDPSVEKCLLGWLTNLGARQDVLAFLTEALADERLLLLVDGLDEWQEREPAVAALTAVISFAQTRRLPLIATGRPAGFDRINELGPEWKRANLLSFDAVKQRSFVRQWYDQFHLAGGVADATARALVVSRDTDSFTGELGEDPEMAELGGVPLLLGVMVYLRLSGRVLPSNRLAASEELVKALLDDQPGHRDQAAMVRDNQAARRSPFVRRGLSFLAFTIHSEANAGFLTTAQAGDLLRIYFRDVQEMSVVEAEEWTTRVLELGKFEFGILVATQENQIGVLHRYFQEFLAAQHLAALPLPDLKGFCRAHGRRTPWHDVVMILCQMLPRPADVDELLDILREPAANPLEAPLREILLSRLASAPINCSRRTARQLIEQVFVWIELGNWLPLRLALVREVVRGLESPHVGELVAARMTRWFPGRKAFWSDYPLESAKVANADTIPNLMAALHNADSPYEFKGVAEGLALCGKGEAELGARLLAIVRGPGDPDLVAGALHALVTGWSGMAELPGLLAQASHSAAEAIRHVAYLARYNRGDRSAEVGNALVGFCRDDANLWPWEDAIIDALIGGWATDDGIVRSAFNSIGRYGPSAWRPKLAMKFLLRCEGQREAVAKLVAAQFAAEEHGPGDLMIFDDHAALLSAFAGDPIVKVGAEAWLARHATTNHNPIKLSVAAKLAGGEIGRGALLGWLKRGAGMPAWIISTLQEMHPGEDPEFIAVLKDYLADPARRKDGARWLSLVEPDQEKLKESLRAILLDGNLWPWQEALAQLVELEGRDAPGLWASAEQRLRDDRDGHYWRLGHRMLIRIWPDQPLVRQRVKEEPYGDDIFTASLLPQYANDREIRPLLDAVLTALHPNLRLELIRGIEPLARRGVAAAINLAARYADEPKAEARTIAARAFAKGIVRTGRDANPAAEAFGEELRHWSIAHSENRQAAVAGLLELRRADVILAAREDDKPVKLDTYASGGHNWEFVGSLVEHWEELAAQVPDLWERMGASPAVVAELVKAGKTGAAASQTTVFEDQLRSGAQIEVDSVRALIALHGRSPLLRDLFIARLKRFVVGGVHSMMVMEMRGYHAMGEYLAVNFAGDQMVHDAMAAVSGAGIVHEVGWIALCRGWPNSPVLAPMVAKMPTLLNGTEPITAWLFAAKADAALMAKYLLAYPAKLRGEHFGEVREGFSAIRNRLAADRECREATFAGLCQATDPDTIVSLAGLLGPVMRSEQTFRDWVVSQIVASRANPNGLAPSAYDALAKDTRSLEFSFLQAVLTR